MYFVGGGCSIFRCSRRIDKICRKIVDAPVCDTLMGKGAFPGTECTIIQECLECTEQRHLTYGVAECDLFIAIGARFSDRVLGNPKKFANKAKILAYRYRPS